MSDIINEMQKLDDYFVDEKIKIVRKFIKSKLEYWQQIPKLHLIYGGEDETFDLVVKNKVYPINNLFFDRGFGFCNINCENAEIVYLNKELNDYVSIEIDKNVKKSLAFSLSNLNLKSIDAEIICNSYTNIKNKHVEISIGAIEVWLMRSIINEIPITLDDFRIHFDNDFGYDDKSFTILYDNCVAKLAGKILTY